MVCTSFTKNDSAGTNTYNSSEDIFGAPVNRLSTRKHIEQA